MATLPEFRNNHAGSSLIQKAEQILQERQANILWCNGRITVSDYYKRLGFQEHGEIFEIEPIGLHKVLYKEYKKLSAIRESFSYISIFTFIFSYICI